MRVIAHQISQLVQQGRQVILVSSGAVGMGAGDIGIKNKITDIKKRQACAAIGQSILMHEYRKAFDDHGQKVAQILLTNMIMNNRKYFLNLKNTVESLLKMGVVPIVNENDCVSIEEIGLAFGDNDRLSALVASKIDAELLMILTDVEGLYNKNPKKNKSAQLIPVVYEVTKEIEAMATKTGTAFSTGGMSSKIEAIKIASSANCKTILAHGRTKDVILKIVDGQNFGTLFLPKRKLSAKKRWILNCQTDCRIDIDAGAKSALQKKRSLLMVGITGISGNFKAGDVVYISDVAKGITRLSSNELKHKLDNRKSHGDNASDDRKAIVHIDNLVLLDSQLSLFE